jgi:YVTN family beta-propeller protein
MLAARLLAFALCALAVAPSAVAQGGFVNWESPHVHPLDLTPNGQRLLAVNTAADRLEVFDTAPEVPVLVLSVPVGVDPVSVRARNDGEAWVVNHLSDTISVVDLDAGAVRATLATGDEPCDVVFAGTSVRAFVTCSQPSELWVFDPAQLDLAPTVVALVGQEPRALARSVNGQFVYVALFESGNRSTVLGGGIDPAAPRAFPPNVVSNPAGPWGGANPPPNAGAAFDPPLDPALGTPPPVSLIVKKDALGAWRDDNGGDWSAFVSGPQADLSGRPVGWDLADHDVARVQASTLAVTYSSGLMNLCMALAVNPANGEVTVVGTDATNEVRFEPNLRGVFLRVLLGRTTNTGASVGATDLNPHLDYAQASLPPDQRALALGDPRAIVWNNAGTKGWVAGMGSDNVVVIGPDGARIGIAPTIEVGQGPTGLAHHAGTQRLFVLNRFDGSISVVSTALELETARVQFWDPTPEIVRAGRVHLYGTHEGSGLGHVACGSCHVDARNDRLAWDLGDPGGALQALGAANKGAGIPGLTAGFLPWHPMKGPMTTQTLQDIVGHEPLHWRGDRAGLEDFGDAFVNLQAADAPLAPQELQAFEDFLASITIPPNPHRELDNTLPPALPLPGRFTSGRFAPAGQPLPDGDPARGLALFRAPNKLDAGTFACATCHTLPTGTGTDTTRQAGVFVPIAPGPGGERHHMLVSTDGVTNRSMKVPQLRTQYDKDGFDLTQQLNTAGFGVLHDGSVDTPERFVAEPVFQVQSDQDVADLTAFLLCFSGSDLPAGSPTTLLEPPGTSSRDTHAAVGRQTTLASQVGAPAQQLQLIADMIALAEAQAIGLIVQGVYGGQPRSFLYDELHNRFQSDMKVQTISGVVLLSAAQPGAELTFTAVPFGEQVRLGVDRDLDGAFDRDEVLAGSDPADPDSTPGGCVEPLPPVPVDLAAAPVSNDRVNLSWSLSSTLEDGFRIERAPAGGAWTLVADLPADSTAWPDTGLDCATTYAWRVSAYNCAGATGFAQVQAQTGACCQATSFCTAEPNSVGPGMPIAAAGSSSIAAGDFTLSASGGPPGNLAVFFYGPAEQDPTPFGDGVVCVAPGALGLFRLLPVQALSATGGVSHTLDFTLAPAGVGPGKIEPGSTWYFQLSYRDSASAGAGFNASDALKVDFCP